jgi:hypothetical protein
MSMSLSDCSQGARSRPAGFFNRERSDLMSRDQGKGKHVKAKGKEGFGQHSDTTTKVKGKFEQPNKPQDTWNRPKDEFRSGSQQGSQQRHPHNQPAPQRHDQQQQQQRFEQPQQQRPQYGSDDSL